MFSKIANYSLWLIVLALVVVNIHQSMTTIRPFKGIVADGPYQVYDALRRLDQGQLPGRDFPAFHGLGISFVYYPLYYCLGQDLFAAELSRQITTRILTIFGYLLFSWLVTKRIWPGLIMLVLSLANTLNRINFPIDYFEIEAGNSLMLLRQLLPLICIGLLTRLRGTNRNEILIGLLLGIAWLLSFEMSVALFLSLFLNGMILWFISKRSGTIYETPRLLRTALWGIGFVLLFVSLIGQQRMGHVLATYFVDIPADQFWYFGTPPNHFLFGDSDLAWKNLWRIVSLLALLIAFWGYGLYLAKYAGKLVDQQQTLLYMLSSAFAGAALISNLGMTTIAYIAVPWRMFFWLCLFLFIDSAWHKKLLLWLQQRTKLEYFKLGFVAISVFLILWAKPRIIDGYKTEVSLSEEWQSRRDQFCTLIRKTHPEPKDQDVWSTYATIVESELGIVHPHTDYIIHALNHQREDYINLFAKLQPAYATTINAQPAMFNYEEWLQTTTWRFYEYLYLNYQIIKVHSQAYLWKRKSQPWQEPATDWMPVAAIQNGTEVELTNIPASAGVAVIELEYDYQHPLRSLPLLHKLPRILIHSTGTAHRYDLAIPPHQTKWVFPLHLNSQTVKFSIATKGITLGATTKIIGVRVRYLERNPAIDQFQKDNLTTE